MKKIKLRFAKLSDAKKVFLWRNDPSTRKVSMNSRKIPWKTHWAWFSSKLQDSACTMWIASSADRGLNLGVIRFDAAPKKKTSAVSIFLKPSQRGKGWGQLILRQASTLYLKKHPGYRITALVKKDNPPSIKVFYSAHYRIYRSSKDLIYFRYPK